MTGVLDRAAPPPDLTLRYGPRPEHVVDLRSDLVLAAEIRPADHADTATLADSLVVAQINLREAGSDAADKPSRWMNWRR